MDGFFKLSQFRNLVLSSVLCTFPLAVLTHPCAFGQININLDEVNFGIKLQKLIDKAYKYYDKLDSNNLIDVVLDIKSEIESYSGKKIDVSKEIDKIESELKRQGGKPPKGIFKQFKDFVKNKEKKHKHRALCMEAYFLDQPNMSFETYESLHTIAEKKQDQKNEKEDLPLKFAVAVSLVLGGAFVMFATPVCPVLAWTGETMMGMGFGMLLDQSLDIYDKKF